MLHPAPRWTFTSRHGLSGMYGHVRLLPDTVLGQWWCVDRETGTVLWQRWFMRPDTVVGISEGVIVASEMRSDGPWTRDFGCYGLSLKTGERLWTSHAEGLGGWLLRLTDAIPGFTNEFRDTARFVLGTECICESGRVLDVRTGRLLRRMPAQELERLRSEQLEQRPTRHYHEESSRAEQAFERASSGYVLNSTNFYSYRFAGPYLYILASEEPRSVPHPQHPGFYMSNRTRYHLLTLDLERGTVAQDIPLGHEPLWDCRIEDMDERSLAVSLEGRELRYYERSSRA